MKPVMLAVGKEKERARLTLECFYKETLPVYDMEVRREQAIYEEYATLNKLSRKSRQSKYSI